MAFVIMITAIIMLARTDEKMNVTQSNGRHFRVFAVIVSQSAEITSRESVLSEREVTRTEIIVRTSSSGAAK